jgi:hypothetical protein
MGNLTDQQAIPAAPEEAATPSNAKWPLVTRPSGRGLQRLRRRAGGAVRGDNHREDLEDHPHRRAGSLTATAASGAAGQVAAGPAEVTQLLVLFGLRLEAGRFCCPRRLRGGRRVKETGSATLTS